MTTEKKKNSMKIMFEKYGISLATHAATGGGLDCENFMHLGPFEN